MSELGEINVNPNAGETRSDHFIGIQAAFAEKHLRNGWSTRLRQHPA